MIRMHHPSVPRLILYVKNLPRVMRAHCLQMCVARHRRFLRITSLLIVIAVPLLWPLADAQDKTGFTYKGVARAVFSSSDLGTDPDATYVRFVQGAGANYVEITIEWFMANQTATTVTPSSTLSPTDAQVIAAIKRYHDLGIHVFLRPLVDTPTYDVSRTKFAPSDIGAWFSSYQSYILHYSRMAQQNQVEGLVIGSELISISGPANLQYWKTLIAAVRTAYGGTLTYAANAVYDGDEYSTVSFWKLLDLIGVDGYFGLTNQDHPSVEQLVSAWTKSPNPNSGAGFDTVGFNAVAALKQLHERYQKPVIFTELGYESSAGTNRRPWAEIRNGYDAEEQANCYTAFFEVFSKESSWMKGVFWWDLNVPLPSAHDQSWSMYGKPAGTTVLPWWFGGVQNPIKSKANW